MYIRLHCTSINQFIMPCMMRYMTFSVYNTARGDWLAGTSKSGQINCINAWEGGIYMGGGRYVHLSAALWLRG